MLSHCKSKRFFGDAALRPGPCHGRRHEADAVGEDEVGVRVAVTRGRFETVGNAVGFEDLDGG
jgi:hypothetical protein